MEDQRPKVGIGVMILKNGEVLLGKRKVSHGAGEYAFPGGHLENGESIIECAKRETLEEAGVEIQNIRLLCLSNEKRYLPKHYVNIGLIADWKNFEPRVLEPEKLESWAWYNIDNLPSPLFDTIINYIEAYKTGKNLFDY